MIRRTDATRGSSSACLDSRDVGTADTKVANAQSAAPHRNDFMLMIKAVSPGNDGQGSDKGKYECKLQKGNETMGMHPLCGEMAC